MVDKIEHISESDVLNAGREKINKFAIDPAMRAEEHSFIAHNVANQSQQISADAKDIATKTEKRLNNIVSSVTKDAEVIDARGNFNILSERLDYLEEVEKKENVPSLKYKMITCVARNDGATDDSIGFNEHGLSDINCERIKRANADAILAILVNIKNKNSVEFEPLSEEILMKNINNAKKHNVNIRMLKPHIVVGWSDAFGRPGYNPADYDLAFKNWGEVLMRYAEICNDNDIEWLSIGCEQSLMSIDAYYEKWEDICLKLRDNYPDLKLTYAAITQEWSREKDTKMFGLLDAIGCNFYPNLTDKLMSENDEVALQKSNLLKGLHWQNNANNDPFVIFDNLSKKFGKEIIITECGTMSRDDALIETISAWINADESSKRYDGQSLYYDVVFTELARDANVTGIALWYVGDPWSYAKKDTITESEQKIIELFTEVIHDVK